MSRIIAILIANFFVVDYGVMPDGKESSVYVIQIEPELAGQLVEGYVIESVIPPELQGIRKFRIQIGNETLTKPTPLLSAPAVENVEDSTIPEVLDTPNDAPDRESNNIDIDAFPLQSEPVIDRQAQPQELIPDDVDVTELPGVPLGLDNGDQEVREVFEPDVTILPPLVEDAAEISLPTVVIEPVFDNEGPDVVVRTSDANAQVDIVPFDLLDDGEAEDRVVLEELVELEISSEEHVESMGTQQEEPELLQNNESDFVRLASTTSSDAVVSNRITSVPPNKTLPRESRSWPLFNITLLVLLVSVGGNVYLGMTVIGFYRKRKVHTSDLPTTKDSISN